MASSANGWSVITSAQLNKSAFPRTGIVPLPGVRIGDVATVLHYVGSQFNSRVEALVNPGCWGYAYRPISGQTTGFSNHASGTAIDLNAPRHPLGKVGTFNSAQVAQIHSILAYCEGVVRWGGDYTGRKDEMHFEINSTAAQVTRIANKINNVVTSPPGGEMPTRDEIAHVYRVIRGADGSSQEIDFQANNKATWGSLIFGFQPELDAVRNAEIQEDKLMADQVREIERLNNLSKELGERPTKEEAAKLREDVQTATDNLLAAEASKKVLQEQIDALKSQTPSVDTPSFNFVEWFLNLFRKGKK